MVLENEYTALAIEERARLLCSSAVSRLGTELDLNSLQPTRAGHIVLFTNDLLKNSLKWTNEHIKLSKISMRELHMHEMYYYLAAMLESHCSGRSFTKTLSIFNERGCTVPDLSIVRFIRKMRLPTLLWIAMIMDLIFARPRETKPNCSTTRMRVLRVITICNEVAMDDCITEYDVWMWNCKVSEDCESSTVFSRMERLSKEGKHTEGQKSTCGWA